ncbi:MAG: winged helix-turn-helix domain-containing protein [Fervidicoccaceae archaeon]
MDSTQAVEKRKYRSDVEILYEIMSTVAASGDRGVKKTHLMYRTNLNSKMLSRYLDLLKSADCIEEIAVAKSKLVKMRPAGRKALIALKALYRILYPPKRSAEEEFIVRELQKLGEMGWNVKIGREVMGRSGADYKPTAVLVREGERYLVQVILGLEETEAKLELLDLIMSALDSNSKAIAVTDRIEIASITPEPAKALVKVVESRPMETLIERIVSLIGGARSIL